MLDKCTISAGNPIFLSPALIAQPEAFLLHRTVRLSNIQFSTPSYWRNGSQVITKECLIRVLPAGTLDVKAVADAPTGIDDQTNYRITKLTFNLSSPRTGPADPNPHRGSSPPHHRAELRVGRFVRMREGQVRIQYRCHRTLTRFHRASRGIEGCPTPTRLPGCDAASSLLLTANP